MSRHWITRTLSLSLSGAFSLVSAEVYFLSPLACLATNVSESDEELRSLVSKLDPGVEARHAEGDLNSLLEELDFIRAELESHL